METISAFLHFSKKVLTNANEGIFWSERNTKGKENWIFGVGEMCKANFEKGPFPFFSIIDFLGKEKFYWHFKQWHSPSSPPMWEEISTYSPKLAERRKKQSTNRGKPSTNFKFTPLENHSNETKKSFSNKIKNVQQAQRAGEMWVINLAHELSGKLKNEKVLIQAFLNFLKSKRTHAGGIVWTKKLKFCSFSPEVFLIQKGQNISTFPIKGTGEKNSLEKSKKEISELHMITDLLRNDLGQIGKQVTVPQERFLTDEKDFFHARAEISAKLKKQILKEAEFSELLPAGSISGAPKKRVIEEILKHESFTRGFYTGTFGVKYTPENSIFNILIRTLFTENGRWKFPVGAGITVESDPEKEWEETLKKARILFRI